MKVAVVGAGLSGLACAIELKRLGVIPDIYEKRNSVGNPLIYTSSILRLFERSLTNPTYYLKKKYGLDVTPLYNLKRITMESPVKKTIVEGNLGMVFKRGFESFSLEKQLEKKLNLPICFNTFIRLEDIEKKYDFIVVASGDDSLPKDLGIWKCTLNTQVRVATVLGDFTQSTMRMWFNTDFFNNCYCYLLPNNRKEATLAMVINDASMSDLDNNWKEFLFSEDISYIITETRDIEINAGCPDSLKYGKFIMTGNCAGMMDDFLGIGVMRSIESGILAARAIAQEEDYVQLIQPLVNEVTKMHEFRKALNTMDNKDLNRLIAFLGLPVVKQFIYNNPLAKVSYGSFAVKLFNRLKRN